MSKKSKSNLQNAAEFGFIGLVIGIGFTLFWPITDAPVVILNGLIGYSLAFMINYVFRSIKYRKRSTTSA